MKFVLLVLALIALCNAQTPSYHQDMKVVDPTDAAEELLGESVAISGTLLVVGAPQKNNQQGAVLVYNCPSTCTYVTTLTAPDAADNDEFGFSVAIDGSTVVVGAPFKSVSGNDFQGAAYVYTCTANGCNSNPIELTQSTGNAYDDFGTAVAVSGSMVVVGADQRTVNSNLGQGSVYVYTCSAGSCSSEVILNCNDCSGGGENFGKAVAVSGSMVAVGAPFRTIGSNGQQGEGYIFDCTAYPTCNLIGNAVATDGADSDNFGTSVAATSALFAFGAPYANGTMESQGAVYVYTCSAGSCQWRSKTSAVTPGENDNYGFSVAAFGTQVVVGAKGQATNGNANTGTAYFLDCSTPTACHELREFRASEPSTVGDNLGFSVSISSTLAAVGSPNHPVYPYSDAGAAYVYYLPTLRCAAVTEGNAQWSAVAVGVTAWGTCASGFHGSPSRVCQAGQTYGPISNPCQANVPFCAAEAYANLNWPQTNPGQTATGSCVSGYTGTATRQCLTTGWSTSVSAHTCTRNVCTSGSGNTADATYPQTNSNMNATGTCNGGYSGVAVRACNADGSWGQVYSSCVAAICGQETYGTGVFPNTGAGMVATGTCVSGWFGAPTRQCKSDHTWATLVQNHCQRYVCAATNDGVTQFPQMNSNTIGYGSCIGPATGRPLRTCDANGNPGPITGTPCH